MKKLKTRVSAIRTPEPDSCPYLYRSRDPEESSVSIKRDSFGHIKRVALFGAALVELPSLSFTTARSSSKRSRHRPKLALNADDH